MKGRPSKNQFWAKLDRNEDGEVVEWHPLLGHSADVAACTEALLEKTILSQRLGRLAGQKELSGVQIARLSALSAIHDSGKVNHGFQNRAWPHRKPSKGHVSPMIEVLTADEPLEWLLPLGLGDMQNWFESESQIYHYLLATWGHHGKPTKDEGNFNRNLWEANETRKPVEGLKQIASAVKSWFPKAFEDAAPLPSDPEFQHAYNGLLTLADWMGSDKRFFGFLEKDEKPMERSRRCVDKAFSQLLMEPTPVRNSLGDEPVSFDVVAEFEPYDIQETCLNLPLNENGSLTVLESDTGSGKTEAALARFARLFQAGLVDGMYFAVPTRSAATQLYERVEEAATRAFPDKSSRPPVVQAVPGYLKVDAVEGVPLPDFDVKWDDESQDLQYRGWAAEHPKRYLAGSIVVGTVDQVLLSTLQVSHAHMRATSLLRHFLVVDEVHASSTYITELMDRVLEQHLDAGGHALLMSATLGTSSRVRLTTGGKEVPPRPDKATEVDYPLVTHVDASREGPTLMPAEGSGRTKDVRVESQSMADAPEKIAKLAVKKAKLGARVLIIRNLVDDCIAVQREVESLSSESIDLFGIDSIPVPHHSRYAPDDRKRMDGQTDRQ